jgi:hypothetical protein
MHRFPFNSRQHPGEQLVRLAVLKLAHAAKEADV